MNKTAKYLMQFFGVFLIAGTAMAAIDNGKPEDSSSEEVVLFKIHDVVPEKDVNGRVLYCNIGATFFNRTNIDIANASLSLKWEDDVIGETIDLEERADKERRKNNPDGAHSRYSTAGFTGKNITVSLKLPPLKSHQQVSLKTKVDTDRCFLLLNDMDIEVSKCGTAELDEKVSRQGCSNLFRYVSPKQADYYVEFKEVSAEKQTALEDAELDSIQQELNRTVEDALAAIKNITADAEETAGGDED